MPFIVQVASCEPKRKKPRRQLKCIDVFQETCCGSQEPEVHLSRGLRWLGIVGSKQVTAWIERSRKDRGRKGKEGGREGRKREKRGWDGEGERRGGGERRVGVRKVCDSDSDDVCACIGYLRPDIMTPSQTNS